MSTHEGQTDFAMDGQPPYPKWWDYLNGVVVAMMMLGTATAVLLWMVQATLTTLN